MRKLLNFCRGGVLASLFIIAMLAHIGCSNSSGGSGPTVNYTVTFDANGGTITTTTQTVPANTATALKTAAALGLSREGYTFGGWAKASSATTADYADGANVTLSANLTLYALWTAAPTLDLSTVTADTVIKDNTIVTGTLGANVKISIADGATVTLKDVTINGTDDASYKWAGLTCAGDATITLEGTNKLNGFLKYYPGLFVPKGKTLTIKGSGNLNASSGNAAGIGGCYTLPSTSGISIEDGSCGKIVIEGGTIIARGGSLSAGIGSGGCGCSCDGVEIKGGTVTAEGGDSAAGIGCGGGSGAGGEGTSCGPISITGGTVTATGGGYAAGVGTGSGASNKCGAITVAKTVTKFKASKGSGATNSVGLSRTGVDNMTCGAVTIGGTEYWDGSAYQNDGATVLGQSPYTYLNLAKLTADTVLENGTTVTGTLGASVKISIAAGASVTLNNVSINADGSLAGADHAGLVCAGDATIVLADGSTNDVKGFMDGPSGVHVLPGFTLTINGSTGVLNASTKGGGAGIGGGFGSDRNAGNIVINGGVINATGGLYGAGIGCGGRSTAGNITINGGTITATAGPYAAGIGCGQTTSKGIAKCGNIVIANTVTKVTATKGADSIHCIGKGQELNGKSAVCGTVTIGGAEGAISDSPYIYQPQP